jgi:hypothetical protein
MIIYQIPDGAIDNKDRGVWLTIPFDLAFGTAPSGTDPDPETPLPPYTSGVVINIYPSGDPHLITVINPIHVYFKGELHEPNQDDINRKYFNRFTDFRYYRS